MLKKLFFAFLLTLGFSVVHSAEANAAVDISLIDSPEVNTLVLTLDSNEASLGGVSIDINFSSNLIIKDIIGSDNYCTMTFDAIASNGTISIECLNESQIPIDGELATVEYENKWGGDYYFFVNETTLDLGANTLGMVVDVNKPDNTEPEEERLDQNNTLSFIRDNYLYITSTVAIIVLLLLFVLLKDRNKA